AAPALGMKSGSSAGTTTPFVAAQAASAGMVVWLLQMPFRATVPLASSFRQISPVPALDSTDPAGQLPLVSLLTTYTWMLELPPPWTKLLRIRTSPSLWETAPPTLVSTNGDACCPVPPRRTGFWRNQKPIWASPLTASRLAPKYTILWAATDTPPLMVPGGAT